MFVDLFVYAVEILRKFDSSLLPHYMKYWFKCITVNHKL